MHTCDACYVCAGKLDEEDGHAAGDGSLSSAAASSAASPQASQEQGSHSGGPHGANARLQELDQAGPRSMPPLQRQPSAAAGVTSSQPDISTPAGPAPADSSAAQEGG